MDKGTTVGEPQVSVCMPVYDGGRYVRESVASVLGQTFEDFELVVLDDASTDETPAVVASFHDPRIRYIRHEHNLGLPANFNQCLRAARCEFMMIFHADDVMLPALVGREFEVLKSSALAVLVYCATRLIDAAGVVYSVPKNRWPPVTAGLDFVRAYWGSRDSGVTMSSVMLRRAVALRLGGFDEEQKHTLDADLWQRMAFEGKVAYVGEVLLSNRVHAGQDSSRILKGSMLEERERYAAATRALVARHGANIDSLISRQITRKVAADLTDLRAWDAPRSAAWQYFLATARRFPRALLSLRLYVYLLLACLPGRVVRALKKAHRTA